MNGNQFDRRRPGQPQSRAELARHRNRRDGSDILFQNTNGQTSIWEMNGNHLIGGGAVGANGGPSWKATGLI